MPENKIYIGTSGWLYKHWIGRFYPEKSNAKKQWQFYAGHFDTVEINNSFYRWPDRSVFEGWYKNSPGNMLFSVKASRFITHMRKLTQPEEPVVKLFENITALKNKLGPILFQLPPKWKINATRLGDFLAILPKGYRYAFEFRNDTWYHEDIFQLLQQHNCAFCIYQLAGHTSPVQVTADFVYVRLHGPTEFKYQGSYNDAALKKWAKQILAWQKDKKDVFLYFDNDQDAYAVFNALTLKSMVIKQARAKPKKLPA